ncbi:MAG: hypothetical protein IPM36_17670 [Lewinellaceae bacterium]|nr:hypothetical protein [Lewinellaceae bacterium]
MNGKTTIGGNGFDGLTSLKPTPDGGCILGGVSSSGISGKKTENNNGDNDCWVVKLDATGNIEWQNTIGGNDHDGLNS